MPLMFYTTDYSPDRALAEVQRVLLRMGARRISQEFDKRTREVNAMSFSLTTARGEREFILPARIDRVQETLRKEGVLRGAGRRIDRGIQRKHAQSVAWRTLLEWCRLQAALIETDQAKVDEVMLPYMLIPDASLDHPQTLYEQFSSDLALPAAG